MRGLRASGPGRSYPGAQVLTREAILRVFGVRNKPPRTPVSLAGEDKRTCVIELYQAGLKHVACT
eukprot:CAMPEP_0171903458 /NCGR_PEP_ID=MMETSP0993-20121228/3020_1 /TAXON_ID=483369 /ORGANISM="non described non described, Strain CCMP2098" /LENGTH=64 /DNA_ID=CAMNT_0012533723 /DNA_START=373 /DNA_END=564 /DNA_ORIENTATION=-